MVDLKDLRHLRVKSTDVANVVHVCLPSLPWQMQEALRERETLLAKLESAFPSRALWLSDWASDDESGWRILARDVSVSSLKDDLTNGAWALFLFERDPDLQSLQQQVPAEPRDAHAALRVLRDLGAAVGLWSWYDNYEWLLVVPPL